jgi:hypothetical protein
MGDTEPVWAEASGDLVKCRWNGAANRENYNGQASATDQGRNAVP